MLVGTFVGLCLLVAAYLYFARQEQVRLQSLVVGGTMGPGCILAEAAVFLFLAVIVLIGWLSGAIHG